jgi:hypothetical protein
MNTYLKNDPRPVLDSEVDLVTGPREEVHPIAGWKPCDTADWKSALQGGKYPG